jgi:hypothetical protein
MTSLVNISVSIGEGGNAFKDNSFGLALGQPITAAFSKPEYLLGALQVAAVDDIVCLSSI